MVTSDEVYGVLNQVTTELQGMDLTLKTEKNQKNNEKLL